MHGDYATILVLDEAVPTRRHPTSIQRGTTNNSARIYIPLVKATCVGPTTSTAVGTIDETIQINISVEYALVPRDLRSSRHMLAPNVRLGSIIQHRRSAAVRVVHQHRRIASHHIVRVGLLRWLRRCHGVDLGGELGFRSTARRRFIGCGRF